MEKKINKRNIKEYIKRIKDDLVVDKLNAVEWIVLGIIILIILVTLFYQDNLGIYLVTYWINESLFTKGSIRFLGNNQLPYGIVQQVFCALWVLPINLLHRIIDFDPACTAIVVWYKLSMSVGMTLCMKEMLTLGEILEITKERRKWMMILFSSTILVTLPVFHIAQTDIIYAYIILIGIRYYLKDDLKRFLIAFAMAISCKTIAIFIFIPLVLMREKRIVYIIRDTFLGTVILVVERLWFKLIDKIDAAITGRTSQIMFTKKELVDGATVVTEKTLDEVNTGFFSHFYHKMLYFEFPAIRKGYLASVLVVLFTLLCIWCYVQAKEDEMLWKQKTIYVTSVAWMIFFANASPSPYWIVVLYPFWFLLFFMKPERIKTNLLLHNGFTLTMFLVYVVNTHWVYGGPSNLDYLLLKGLIKPGHDSVDGPYVARYLNNLGIESLMNVITALCLATVIGLIVLNYHRVSIDDRLDELQERKNMHSFTIWQIGILAVWYVINVWVVQRW